MEHNTLERRHKYIVITIALLLLGHLFTIAKIEAQPVSKVIGLISNDQQSGAVNQDEAPVLGERVDKLASATGDLYWPPQDWYQQALNRVQQQGQLESVLAELEDFQQRHQASLVDQSAPLRAAPAINKKQQLVWTTGYYPTQLDLDGVGARNYHALVNEFKQWSHLANPTRESRAFKPKLMSTARGFGKRAYPYGPMNSVQQVSYADLMAPSTGNANGPSLVDGKMSGRALR